MTGSISEKRCYGSSLGSGIINLALLKSMNAGLGDRILDVGCGMGFVPGNLESMLVVGLDSYRRKYWPVKHPGRSFISADGQSIPIQKNCFDTVLCMDVLEHVEEPEKVVDEVKRVLTPGGNAFFSAPVADANFFPGATEYTRKLHGWWGHKRAYVREDFISLVEDAGFKITRTSDYGYLSARFFLYIYYAATNITGDVDGVLVRFFERLLYNASRLDQVIPVWSAFSFLVEAEK